MPYQVLAPEAQPCVWMCAGLISYKLCERGFDCENCPLDAALRGTMCASPRRGGAPLEQRSGPKELPEDRLYAPGHLWVQSHAHDDIRVWRVGLDAFAAALIGCATGVTGVQPSWPVHRGERICDVDLGMGSLTLHAPVGGRVLRTNPILGHDPRRAVTEPYEDGWLVEIQGLDAGAILGLRSAAQARAFTDQDLRHFRRSLALRLLTEPAAAAGSEPVDPLSDLRNVLGGDRYLELVGQFVH